MSINAAVSAINVKLLVVIIGLLITIVGIGTKYAYDQHQVKVLMQAQSAKQEINQAIAKAKDDAIRAEFKRRENKKRSEGKSHFEFKSW